MPVLTNIFFYEEIFKYIVGVVRVNMMTMIYDAITFQQKINVTFTLVGFTSVGENKGGFTPVGENPLTILFLITIQNIHKRNKSSKSLLRILLQSVYSNLVNVFLQTLNFHCLRWLKEKNSTLSIIQVRVNELYKLKSIFPSLTLSRPGGTKHPP